jgi:transposase-like protein
VIVVYERRQSKQASISTIARKYDLNSNQVFRWIRGVEHNEVKRVRVETGQVKLIKLPAQTPTFLPVTVSQRAPVHPTLSTT